MIVPLIWHPLYDPSQRASEEFRALLQESDRAFPDYRHVRQSLAGHGYAIIRGRLAKRPELEAAHAPAYVRAVSEVASCGAFLATLACFDHDGPLDADCAPFGPEVLRQQKAAVGGTLRAVEHALAQGGVCVNLFGGLAHAGAQHGARGCIFNDLAVACRRAALPTLVVDSEARHDEGIAAALADDPYSLILALPEGAGAEGQLNETIFTFRPHLVLYRADLIKREDAGRRHETVVAACARAGLPLVITLSPAKGTREAITDAAVDACRAAAAYGRVTPITSPPTPRPVRRKVRPPDHRPT
jgi:hypothetical protein